jgi:G6PDH family F420-dependent oxidoreductase
MRIGYFLSCEECTGQQLVDQAALAEQAGFEALWISDHFHPWNDEQGQSPFVWSVIGAISQVCALPVTTAVTCPTVRTHPVVVAQAAATAATMLHGGFTLGVGSGEALNEHVTGENWPGAPVRLEMLEEAVGIMRELWDGDFVYHRGTHYTVDNARIYSRPERSPLVYVSGLGPEAVELAARIGDGYISTVPDADLVRQFRKGGGGDKPAQGGVKVCWSTDKELAIDTAHRLWRNSGVPGELSQVLPSPRHFEQASQLVTREMTADAVVCGDDVDEHVGALQPFIDAGFDEVYVSQMGAAVPGTDAEGFFDFYASHVLPAVRKANR